MSDDAPSRPIPSDEIERLWTAQFPGSAPPWGGGFRRRLYAFVRSLGCQVKDGPDIGESRHERALRERIRAALSVHVIEMRSGYMTPGGNPCCASCDWTGPSFAEHQSAVVMTIVRGE